MGQSPFQSLDSSCAPPDCDPGVTRASTSSCETWNGVDGRDKPGHDVERVPMREGSQ
jgi:hypothetical protein